MAAQRLCKLEDLADGASRGFDPCGAGQDSLLLVRQGAQVYAYRDLCPHYGDTPLPWRRHAYLDAARRHIVCAAHGALFEIATGACVRGPCLGQSLSALAVSVDADGYVVVEYEPLRALS